MHIMSFIPVQYLRRPIKARLLVEKIIFPLISKRISSSSPSNKEFNIKILHTVSMKTEQGL